MHDKIIVSNKAALTAKYGSTGVAKIEKAIRRLISADAKRGIKSRLVYLDKKAAMKSFRGKAVDDPNSPPTRTRKPLTRFFGPLSRDT